MSACESKNSTTTLSSPWVNSTSRPPPSSSTPTGRSWWTAWRRGKTASISAVSSKKSWGKKVTLLVSTHYFSDHLAAWALFPGVPIIAHRNYRWSFDSEAFRTEEEKRHFVEPTVLVGDGLEVAWGRFHLDVFYNPGHTLCSLAIDVAEADLLLAGDAVVGNIVYLFYGNVSLKKRALERLRDRRRGKLLSSHTGVSDPLRLDRALHYLERLEEAAANARAEGGRYGDISLSSCLPRGVPGTEFERLYHGRNLNLIAEGRVFPA